MSKIERTVGEVYQDDPERADAVVFGRRTDVSRRGFLGGSGMAALSAAVGGPIVFGAAMPRGLIPAALAQEANGEANRAMAVGGKFHATPHSCAATRPTQCKTRKS